MHRQDMTSCDSRGLLLRRFLLHFDAFFLSVKGKFTLRDKSMSDPRVLTLCFFNQQGAQGVLGESQTVVRATTLRVSLQTRPMGSHCCKYQTLRTTCPPSHLPNKPDPSHYCKSQNDKPPSPPKSITPTERVASAKLEALHNYTFPAPKNVKFL